MSKFCCPNCFNDDHVSQFILDRMESKGVCDYCGSSSVALIDPKFLFSFMEQLDVAFEVHEEGESLRYSPMSRPNYYKIKIELG